MQIALMGGDYQARGIIASVQRCLNLYPEINQRENFLMLPQAGGAPTLLTHYPTPGLTLKATAFSGAWRGLYRANNGTLYGVCGQKLYAIDAAGWFMVLGSITSTTSFVSMSDNGITLVLVDGSTNGYLVDLATNAMSPLVDPTGSFVGADKVDYLDTFFIFNSPGTQSFYCSLSNSVTFDPLYLASKTGAADLLVTLKVFNRQIWLFGQRTTEIWQNVGGILFPFALTQGVFIEHGCAAKYSVCAQDTSIFWLSKNAQGEAIVLRGDNYAATRISTHAIEQIFQTYGVIDDAIGHIHQVAGHTFYVLTFPTGNATWVFDVSTSLWHERAWMDSSGNLNRVRPVVGDNAYGQYFCGDWQNANLYVYDIDNYTDNGEPILRIRSFPHVVNELKRLQYNKFIADMEIGQPIEISSQSQTSTELAPTSLTDAWADTVTIGTSDTVIAPTPSYVSPVYTPKIPCTLYGFTLQSFWYGDFQNQGEVLSALIRMKNEMGCNLVTIGYLWYSPTYTSNLIQNSINLVPSVVFAGPFDTAHGATPLSATTEPQQQAFIGGAWGNYYNFQLKSAQPADITWVIQQAVALGFTVAVKPQVDFAGGLPWRAYAAPTTPGAPGTAGSWFDNYNTFIVAQATLAQAAGATYFFVGNENVSMVGTAYTTQWNTICTNVRAVFTGKIIYAAASWNGPSEAMTTGIWPYVDYCGFDFYPQLLPQTQVLTPATAISTILAAFTSNSFGNDYLTLFQNLLTYAAKPLFLGETGTMNWNGALYEPYQSTGDGSNNQTLQAWFFQALFEFINNNFGTVPIFGMAIWLWRPFSYQALPEDYTVWGKQASDVIAKWLQGTQSPVPTRGDAATFPFENSPEGFSNFPNGLTVGAATGVSWNSNPANAFVGDGSLGIAVDLQPTSSQYKLGQVYLYRPIDPQNMTGLFLSCRVYVPAGFQGSSVAPNAFRIMMYDKNFNISQSGPQAAPVSGWSLLVQNSSQFYAVPGFDITNVIGVGIMIEGDSYQPQPGATLYGYAGNIPATFYGNSYFTLSYVSGTSVVFGGTLPPAIPGIPGVLGFGTSFLAEAPDGLTNIGAWGLNLSDTVISVALSSVTPLPSAAGQTLAAIILYDWQYNSYWMPMTDLYYTNAPVLTCPTPLANGSPQPGQVAGFTSKAPGATAPFDITKCIAISVSISNLNQSASLPFTGTIGPITQAPASGQAGCPATLGPNNFSGTIYLDQYHVSSTAGGEPWPLYGWYETPVLPISGLPAGAIVSECSANFTMTNVGTSLVVVNFSNSDDGGVTWSPWAPLISGAALLADYIGLPPTALAFKIRVNLYGQPGQEPSISPITVTVGYQMPLVNAPFSGSSEGISLTYSDDRGATWSTPQIMANTPSNTSGILQWRRLGISRDKVFEISWSFPGLTALNGAFIDVEPCAT